MKLQYKLIFALFVLLACALCFNSPAQADTITLKVTGSGTSVPTSDPTKPIFDFLAKGGYHTSLGHVRQVKLLRLIICHWSLVICYFSLPSAPIATCVSGKEK